MANYPGANAETIEKSVLTPIEIAINGVEDMLYMSSEVNNSGECYISVFFKQGTDADMAVVNVKNRIAMATPNLPAEVNQIGVNVEKQQKSVLRNFVLRSPNGTYDPNFLANYVKIEIEPALLRVSGVGRLQLFAGQYAMRIWLDPQRMAQYNLIPADVTAALNDQSIEISMGALGENYNAGFQYSIKYQGRYISEEQYGNIIIKASPNGELLKLKDVARVELGAESYSYSSDNSGVFAMVYQATGANGTETNNNIDLLFNEISERLPEDIELVTLSNTNDFLFASIKNVVLSLFIAVLLVVLVIYFFLQDIRATLIPTLAIIVSLVGTFMFLNIVGYSLNLLTLFALVLVIGTVVDNAIVVVEAVQARFEAGEKAPYKATIDAMKGLVSPIVVTSFVFMAVFIPVSFTGGTTGIFYAQCGITMAVAVLISTINALTLSPVLCVLLLRPNKEGVNNFASRVRTAYNASYQAVIGRYKNTVVRLLNHKWVVWASLLLVVILLGFFLKNTQKGFVPDEDMGILYVNVATPIGTSLLETAKLIEEVGDIVGEMPQTENYTNITGFSFMSSGSNAGMIMAKLKHWDERKEDENSINAVINEIYGRTAHLTDATIFTFSEGVIPGYGVGNNLELHVLDKRGATIEELYDVTQDFLAKLSERPEFDMVISEYHINNPQYELEVDPAKCMMAGVSQREVLSVLSDYLGSVYASNMNRFNKVFRVQIQAEPNSRKSVEDLNNIYVRVNGTMTPVTEFVTLKRVFGPEKISHFNLYKSILVNGQPAQGYSTIDAINAVNEVAKQTLPMGYGYEFGGMTREQNETKDSTALIYAICAIFVYLILAALYNSFLLPFAVMLSIPFGMMGSLLAANIFGVQNDIYLQMGMIMLIGLLAKTAILITEYASERRKNGLSISQAAVAAAKARLRAILMTVLTMIFGMLPLIFSTGVGANANRTLGSSVVGGMVIGTLALLLIVPILFTVFQSLQEKFTPIKIVKSEDPNIIAELEEHLKEKENER